MHVLDNPVWHALSGPASTVGDDRNGPLARRYHPDVAPFAALPDEPDAGAWDALRTLVGGGNVAVLLRTRIEEPGDWTCLERMPGLQMLPGPPWPAPDLETVELGTADVPEMLELVARTRPGPFGTRTVELGTYLGVREDDRLVAMAGERMRPPGLAEISAVCVDRDHRRRGLAAGLMAALSACIATRGDEPFLHLGAGNETALRTYEALGFTVRTPVDIAILQAPA